MKKIFLALSIVAVSFAANAQKESLTTFGAKAGVNFSNVSITGASTSMKIGFHVGAFANIPVASSLSLNPEVVYSAEGAKESGSDASINLNFINIPVLFQYNHESGFFAQTGPQIGFVMSANEKAGDQKADIKDQINSTNFSWVVGAGYKLASGFGFDARYNIGLSNLAKDASGGNSAKASAIQVSLFKSF